MTIRAEIIALLTEMVNPSRRLAPFTLPVLKGAPESESRPAHVQWETPDPLEPKAIYLDRESFSKLMDECSLSDLHTEGTFQSIPLYIVQRYGVKTGKHIHVHGEPY